MFFPNYGPGSTGGLLCPNVGGAGLTWLASAQAGEVKVLGSAGGTGLTGNSSPFWNAVGLAAWGDRLAIIGGSLVPSTIALTVLWDGTLDAREVDGPNLNGFGYANAKFNYGFFATPTGTHNGYLAYGAADSVLAQSTVPSPTAMTVFDQQTFLLPVGISRSWDFETIAQATAQLGLQAQQPGGVFDAFATADMSHTGRITSLAFLDYAGNDITSGVQYAFTNGTQIYPLGAPTATPEPATWVPVGGGLLVLVVARARTRHVPSSRYHAANARS